MQRREFGKTGVRVSAVSLGTVELGGEYGVYRPSERRRPTERVALRLLLRAFEGGIDLVDTAPAYGGSERLVGRALREWRQPVRVATKVGSGGNGAGVAVSLEASLRRMGVECLDVVQVHNPAAADIADGAVFCALEEARRQGKLLFIGASVYGVDEARAALRLPSLDVLQVAYNLLDRRMEAEVFPEARARGVALLIRSALLKGVLTDRRGGLPPRLLGLRRAADRADEWARGIGETLPRAALRFCLRREEAASVLVGVRDAGELNDAIEAAGMPPLGAGACAAAERLGVDDDALLDPRGWGIR